EIGLDRIGVSAEAVVVARDARGGRAAQRKIETELDVAASVSAVDAAATELGESFLDAHLGLVRYVANGPGQRTGAEQGALRTARPLDAIRVEEIEVRRKERERDDRLVEVDSDLLLHARLVAHDLPGRDAAHRHLTLARSEVLHRESADVRGDAFDV